MAWPSSTSRRSAIPAWYLPSSPIPCGSTSTSVALSTMQCRAGLADRFLLLVLDNMEQVADAAPFVARMLSRAPRLRILITSRVPLWICGEREFAVDPLPLPTAGEVGTGSLAGNAAVTLFMNHVRATQRPDADLRQRIDRRGRSADASMAFPWRSRWWRPGSDDGPHGSARTPRASSRSAGQ